MRRPPNTKIAQLLVAFAALAIGFQNCTSGVGFDSSKTKSQYSGNGEGYSGKIVYFRFFDPSRACEADRTGKPLPNEQIFFQPKAGSTAKAPFLVRENCKDIEPRELSAASVAFSPGFDSLTHGGHTYVGYQPSGDFDVAASACPTGKTPIAGATRTNLLVASQDWLAYVPNQGWIWHDGIVGSLDGTIASLPSFRLLRNDSSLLEEYRKPAQFLQVRANAQHAFTFLAKPGNTRGMTFRYYRGDSGGADEEVVVDLDLTNLTTSTKYVVNMAAPQATIVPFGNGFLCTVYFTTTARGDQGRSEVGVSPMGVNFMGALGDHAFATAAQLERVDDFCR